MGSDNDWEEILVTERLTKRFGGLVAVKDVDFSLRKGEVRAIIGPNGAGKTTFFNLLAGTHKRTSGKIIFKGHDITSMAVHERVKLGIGRSFQIVNVCRGLSVRKNIEIAAVGGLKKGTSPFGVVNYTKACEHAGELLREFGLDEYGGNLAESLLYGNQKKLEVVLALALEPDVLLLDEPAAGADEEGVRSMMSLVKQLASLGKTVLITDHDIKFVLEVADRITVFNQGEILAEGLPREISGNRLVQEAYLGLAAE